MQKNNVSFDGVRLHVLTILTKSKYVVRSGIRAHAYKSRLRPERSALDRSAILTYKSPVSSESFLAKLWTFSSPESLDPLSRRSFGTRKKLRCQKKKMLLCYLQFVFKQPQFKIHFNLWTSSFRLPCRGLFILNN